MTLNSYYRRMAIRLLTTPEDLKLYDSWVRAHLHGNLWQSLERKKYLEAIGKDVKIYVAEDGDGITASAMVMIDKTSFGLSTWDIARGPIVNYELGIENYEILMEEIIRDAKKQKIISLFLSPLEPIPDSKFIIPDSGRHIHCTATRLIDLALTEDQILKQMKPKGRYNIGVAEKHGVTVTQSEDIDAFYGLVKETTARDGFTGLSRDRYKTFLTAQPGSFLLLAHDAHGAAVAGLLGVMWPHETGLPTEAGAGHIEDAVPPDSVDSRSHAPAKVGIYYYGASSHAHRALMAPYLIQWEAIKLCKTAGCTHYDLLGVAPKDAHPDHPWSGITSFKEKFGGSYIEYPGERELTLKPLAKRLLTYKRKILG